MLFNSQIFIESQFLLTGSSVNLRNDALEIKWLLISFIDKSSNSKNKVSISGWVTICKNEILYGNFTKLQNM
jgi:hypothetical protein